MTTLYIPTFAESLRDLEISHEYLGLLPRAFNKGLMFVIKNGGAGLAGGKKELQYKNFQKITDGAGKLPVIIMTANLPLSDLDFYHLPEKSATHIRAAIDFADGLPGRLPNPIVTFHLNTLLPPNEWNTSNNYEKKFDREIIPLLEQIADYSNTKNVALKIETSPIPEFGDSENTDLKALINPYPIYSKYFKKIRKAGLGVALDVCHTYALLQKLSLPRTLMDEVSSLQSGDVIHLNDGQPPQEGITLGEGKISDISQVTKLVAHNELHLVFEINETDYVMRPGLIKSINYFNEYAI